MTSRILIGAACALAVTACGGPPPSTPVGPALDVEQPAGWKDDVAMPTAADVDPDPDVVEVELEASITELEIVPGTRTPVWTYNAQLPGPLIRAEVGDTIVVEFTNSLPEATSIHWHGLRLPNDMDGVPGVTQDPIEPGGTFRYEFVARDAGTFWYHPHVNSADQVGKGLYGALVVEDPDDPDVFGDDLVLLVSDMSLDEDGQFLPADQGGEFGDLFGREGRIVLVNGQVRPRLKVRAGKPQRWRVINGARSRYFKFQLREHELVHLGGDNGLRARSARTRSITVVPGERADFVFTPSDPPGSTRTLEWIPTERGFGSQYGRRRLPMLDIETVDARPVEPEPIPEKLREIEPIDVTDAAELTLDLTIDTEPRRRHGNDVVMGINGEPYWEGEALKARVGETQIWNVTNDTPFAHPFHLHGFFFQVLDDTRIPEWKDTIDVPAESSVRIAVRFDERPGVWMYHCHILDHATSGMMGHLWVAAADDDSAMPDIDTSQLHQE